MSSFQRDRPLTKNLYDYMFLGAYTEKECILCGANETPSEGNILKKGRKASNWSLLHDLDPPHRSRLIRSYLAKKPSFKIHSACLTSCLPMASCYRSWKCRCWGCQTKFDNIVEINVTKSVQKCFNIWRNVEVSVTAEGKYFSGKFVYTLDAWSLI